MEERTPKSEIRTEVVASERLTAEVAAILDEWTQAIFGEEEVKYEWAAPQWRVLAWVEGRPASHLAITDRVASVADTPVRVAGIGGVMTPPEWRGRGLAQAIMTRAAEFMRQQLHVDFGLLLCSDALVAYYERLGWRAIEAPLDFQQTHGTVRWAQRAMVLSCKLDTWPPGTVDLCGLPW